MKNEECNRAILRMIDKIDLDKVNRFIDEIPYMSDVRKQFYKNIIILRYNIIKSVCDKVNEF